MVVPPTPHLPSASSGWYPLDHTVPWGWGEQRAYTAVVPGRCVHAAVSQSVGLEGAERGGRLTRGRRRSRRHAASETRRQHSAGAPSSTIACAHARRRFARDPPVGFDGGGAVATSRLSCARRPRTGPAPVNPLQPPCIAGPSTERAAAAAVPYGSPACTWSARCADGRPVRRQVDDPSRNDAVARRRRRAHLLIA